MNIYQILQEDHRRFQLLLDKLLERSKADSDEWKVALDELRSDLIPHAHAEEAILYNALRENDKSKDLVAHSYREHAMAEAEIRALGAAKMIDANWTSLVNKLRTDLLHHIEEEEGKVFASARQIFSEEEAQQLGAAFLKLKTEMSRDAHSVMASTIDLVANLLPRRLVEAFRNGFRGHRKSAA
jgi:hemerythrin superfamily protein